MLVCCQAVPLMASCSTDRRGVSMQLRCPAAGGCELHRCNGPRVVRVCPLFVPVASAAAKSTTPNREGIAQAHMLNGWPTMQPPIAGCLTAYVHLQCYSIFSTWLLNRNRRQRALIYKNVASLSHLYTRTQTDSVTTSLSISLSFTHTGFPTTLE